MFREWYSMSHSQQHREGSGSVCLAHMPLLVSTDTIYHSRLMYHGHILYDGHILYHGHILRRRLFDAEGGS